MGWSSILARNIATRPTDPEDLKFLWAAYKKGDFDKNGVQIEEGLNPKEFQALFAEYLEAYQFGINTILFNGQPIAAFLYTAKGRVLELDKLIWFSWASNRNVLEGLVAFLHRARTELEPLTLMPYKVLIYSREKDKKLFEKIMDAGVVTRVGQIGKYFEDGTATLYATKEV